MASLVNHLTERLVYVGQIRAARALLGWTQRDLGKALGVNERQIRFWERRIPPNQRTRFMIIEALKVHGVEFLGPPLIGVRLLRDP